ncbi:MAG TPA: histidine phosphatase family protein [Chthoniobacterales bacterium]|nr:histidine phosphatase family protein [Chthoniobacterales bacterium]
MLLYFLRHAEAEDEVTSDFERRLTPKGLDQADKVGRFCVRNGLIPDVILSSPVVRAEQTAHGVSKRLDDRKVIIERWIACGMAPETCLSSLQAYAKFEHVMLVGHEPDFSFAIAACLGLSDPSHLNVRKASLTAISLPLLRAGAGRLEFTVPVRLM